MKVIFSFSEQHPVLFYHAGYLGSHLEITPSYFLTFPGMENPVQLSINCTEG